MYYDATIVKRSVRSSYNTSAVVRLGPVRILDVVDAISVRLPLYRIRVRVVQGQGRAHIANEGEAFRQQIWFR